MAEKKVKLKDQLGRVVRLDDGSSGATLGVNLYGANGKLLTAADIINPPPQTGTSSTVWKLIREVPANLKAIAALDGVGHAVRRTGGEWALRTIQPGEGIGVEDGDGDAGDPTIALADLTDSGDGEALLKITRDAKGRIRATAPATTDDLPQGATNKYFPEAPNDGYDYARGALAWQPLTGPLSKYVLLELSPVTDQLGNPLTDQQGRPLYFNTPQIPLAWIPGVQSEVKTIYPLSALPPVTPFPREIYVSGTSGVPGIIPAYSNGVNWLRFSDNTPVN